MSIRKCLRCSGTVDRPSRSARVCCACTEKAHQRYLEGKRRRASLTPAVRRIVIDRDGMVCRHCACAVRPRRHRYDYAKDTIELDHLIPVAEGGSNEACNVVVSCMGCNRKREGEQQRRARSAA